MDARAEGSPAHQLHAQTVLLPAVVAVDLLFDLQQGRRLCLLCGLADILKQTEKRVVLGRGVSG